jgi:HEAT repeats
MSKSGDSALGFCLLLFMMVHIAVGFMLMISAISMGIPDFTGVELHPLVGFPIIVVAVGFWSLAGLNSINWILTGSRWFGPEPPDFRRTFVGTMSRVAASAFRWFVVLGSLALVPADRSVMIVPLSLFGESAMPLATWFLHDSSPRVRCQAIEVLKRIGPPARSQAPEIAKHLDDPDEQVRLAASSALRILNPELLPP